MARVTIVTLSQLYTVVFQQLPLPISPDSQATFCNTYISKANRELVTTLHAFGCVQVESFIFLWGSNGSGITHLLEATQNKLHSLSIQYLPLRQLKDFPPELILEGIDDLDLICIDDFQEICGEKKWEQSLFNLFNQVRDSNNRLLVGSHLSPRQLPLVLPDLKSRMQWGTVFQLQSFSEEEKIGLLKFKASKLAMALPDDVIYFLIQRVGRSIADLLMVMDRLDKASLIEQRRLTIPFVKKILKL